MPIPAAELRAFAAHEIGHAVVNRALGLRIASVWINERGGGRCRLDHFDHHDPVQLRAYAVGCLAGYASEARWCERYGPGRPEHGSAHSDYALFRRAAKDLRRNHGIRLTTSQAESQARKLVRAHWRDIKSLTPKLAAHGHLHID